MATTIHLVLGGARSGKSDYAEQKAQAYGGDGCLYVATAEARDQEMKQRVEAHRRQRNPRWQTLEASQNLGSCIVNHADSPCILVDCLTLWLSRSLEAGTWATEKASFLDALRQAPTTIVMVSNEVGCGIVPMGQLTREFVDETGWLHQDVAAIATDVTMVVAGLPQCLKAAAP